ncbi:TlpA family protein disulfide reductase [Chitinophaga sp. GCM10012297]|uniref:TlpA family protein disulfide reductase n=1 Tax=Chitinophaga chungangae TaxID=2821488 RepID=A0ABS3YKX1_9BACT|nr:TlpA disulfide reductase family protein [Chitinophaga chungangae]MBO9155338.1 TlpA family protein disulfide reductase [Chitinophaga chungangae]
MKTLLVLLLCTISASAQQVRKINPAQLETLMKSSDSVTVVNLWATWCVPCIKELPAFEKQARLNPSVRFVYVSLDLDEAYPGDIRKFVRQRKLSGEVYWMEEPNANVYARIIDPRWEGSIPATVILNPAKAYRKFIEGVLEEEQLQWELSRAR